MSGLTRLLLVSEPGIDGVFDYVRTLTAHLLRWHPEITLDLAYSSRRSGQALPILVEAIRARGGEAVDLKIGNAPGGGDVQAVRKILDLVRRHQPQLVHAHSSKAGALARLLRALRPGFPPVIYTPNAYYGLGGKRSLAAFVFNTAEALLGRVGVTSCCSSDERTFARDELHLPPRKLVLINTGIDLERFRPGTPEEKKACRAEFGLPENGILLVTVGRDNPQKNYAPLYAAMETILGDAATPCLFAHAGAGSEKLGATLSPAAQKRFRGFTHIASIERFLRAADGFILTSRYEGLSLGMLQALCTDLKMFLTRVPGNRCLASMGFSQVEWIEPSEEEGVLAAHIGQKLRAWLARPLPPDDRQLPMVRRSFDQRVQFEKVHRLYGSQISRP